MWQLIAFAIVLLVIVFVLLSERGRFQSAALIPDIVCLCGHHAAAHRRGACLVCNCFFWEPRIEEKKREKAPPYKASIDPRRRASEKTAICVERSEK